MTDYVLATGAAERERLALLQEVYGPVTEAALRAAGLRPGMRVVEIGCGNGIMACWLGEQVGPTGAVLGLDQSPAQVEEARRLAAARGLGHVTFDVAEANAPGAPAAAFDLAYCRLVLMHLPDPLGALRVMGALVRPGGAVVAVEMDVTRWLCDPPSAAVERCYAMNLQLATKRGENFRIATSLHALFDAAGLEGVEARADLPLIRSGPTKHLLRLSFEELAPVAVLDGVTTPEEVADLDAELRRIADDPHTLLGMPLVVAVRGVSPR
ncbi:MAG: class I SAM-dependent methyltransferase [bacterium]|nr:class I SAM-dependent methyltransferase [bacterium]